MDINNFGPFHPDIWGTFSDWLMVIVTALTAYYLIRTFRSQKEVQKLQQISTEIEQRRYESEIRPDVNVKLSFPGKEIHVDLTPINREIRNLTYKISQVSKGISDLSTIKNLTPSNYVLGYPIPLKYTWNREINDYILLSIDLTYQDEIDNYYDIKIAITKDGIHLKRGPHKKVMV